MEGALNYGLWAMGCGQQNPSTARIPFALF